MIVHPSLMLIASLDEREYNEESAADVKRAFVHLAPTTVRKHAATEPACNVLQLKVNFSKKYWNPADKGADEMWDHVKEWFAGKRYFVGENIKSFNKSRGERGEQTVDYRQIDLLMAKNTLHIAIEPGCGLPAFEDVAEQLRALMAKGAVEGDAVEVYVPSSQSLAQQRAAWQKACDVAAAAQAAEQQAAAGEKDASEQQPAVGAEAAAGQPEGEPAAPEAETAEPAATTFPPLAIDYSVWGVVQGDAQREFDPAQGAWL